MHRLCSFAFSFTHLYRHSLFNYYRHFLSVLLVTVCLFVAGCSTIPSEYIEPPLLSADERTTLNQRVFEKAVDLVEDKYFDESFGGRDWTSLQNNYHVEAVAAEDTSALYDVLNDMFSEMEVSHLGAITPRRSHQLRNQHQAAIGVRWTAVEGGRVIVDVVPGGPAASAGVLPGWLVVARDGVDLPKIEDDDYVALLDQLVNFDFLDQDDQLHSLTFSPELLNFRRLEVRSLPGDVVYLRFDEFNHESRVWLNKQLKEHSAAPAVVIDLRLNGGGNLLALQHSIADFFPGIFGNGTVATGSRVKRNGKESEGIALPWFSAHYEGRVAILTDSSTGSAAEIFSHVLQYHGRAKVFGRNTAGAVIISRRFELPDHGMIQIPVVDYIGLDEQRLEGQGVTPDQLTPVPTRAQRLAMEDPDLEAALEELMQGT